MRLVAVKNVGDQTRATRQVQELIGKTNQTTGRNTVFQAHPATAVRFHVDQVTLALTQRLHHATLVLFLNVSGHQFDGFVAHAINVLEHHARLAHRQLVAFSAHVFQQNGQVQFAPAHDFEDTFFVGFADAQGHIRLQFFLQAIPNLTAGDELAFTTGQRTGVDAEVHGQRGFIDPQHRQRCGCGGVGDGDTNANVGNAVDQHNFTRAGFVSLHPIEPLKSQHLIDAPFDGFAIRAFHNHHVHHRLDGALLDAPNANSAHKSRKIERRNLQLQRCLGVALLVRHVL